LINLAGGAMAQTARPTKLVTSGKSIGEFQDTLHLINTAGRKSVDPMRWQPMAPGSWEQGTTILPGESALDVIQQVERELAAESGEGGHSEPSQLLAPATRNMIIATEARIAQIEGRPPPKPPHDELAEIMALRAEQDALARASKAAKAARDATDAALPPAESKAGMWLRRLRYIVNPIWWLTACVFRFRAASVRPCVPRCVLHVRPHNRHLRVCVTAMSMCVPGHHTELLEAL
jgi:hypothetical protein